MPFSYVAAAAPLIGSVAGGLLGGSSAPSANVYQPGGTSSVDSQLQALLSQNSSLLNNSTNSSSPYNTLSPQMAQVFQSLFNSPGQAGYQTSANNAGTAYTGVGNQTLNNTTALSGQIGSLLQNGNTVAQMGLDPQQALYNQQLQLTNDQSNVNNAAYGLTGQQAAANTNQADQNFNTSWQNQELQRALTGLEGQAGAATVAGTAATTAQNTGSAGAGSILAGGAAPYTAGQTIGAGQETALAQYLSQLLGPTTAAQGTIGDLGAYLGQGINASASQGSQALADYYGSLTGGAAGSIAGSSLGTSLAGLFNTQATPAATNPANAYGPFQSTGF